MAQLDVQPKKRSSAWIWVVILLVVVGVLFTLYRGYNKSYHPTELKTVPADSAAKDTVVKNDTSITRDTGVTDTAAMDTTSF
ncbi:hypothetical protein [Mucilaginibacter pedocola]|uniref:Uncharacterized protein n=1 Tax=Mucilaginibacter pedocola TaxID=1792845 RepID=A0A1S9PEW9_9SPHI|nr:hypothetical protein [Mucilaginibacter pedocola]OOQ59503.1 hypothetical protein BC343_04805 [Mucilaginibacter pedocola]